MQSINPFSTRYVRPGAIPFEFPPEAGGDDIVRRLAAAAWQGQIVGPHGSGKSTLLATLAPLLVRCGRQPRLIELHDGQRGLAPAVWQSLTKGPGTLLVVDGYEQLGRLARWRLAHFCRRHGAGVLVTTHRDVGLPLIWRTRVDLPLALRLVERLAPETSVASSPIGARDIAACVERHRGNLREVFFDLYDLYRLRQP